MLGAIIGDIIGSRFEVFNHKSKEFELFTDDCRVTDDSIMTFAVAKALMNTDKAAKERGINLLNDEYLLLLKKNAVHCMQMIGRKYRHCGYGAGFIEWIFSNDPKPYYSYGNGAAMRISPVGLFAHSEEEVFALSDAVTSVSHDHPEGMKGARATALAVFLAKSGLPMEKIKKRMEEFYALDFTVDEIRPTYRFDASSQGTVPQALQCFFESTSYKDAIRTAVSLGGDTDTIAAITGGIAGVYFGIPEDIKEQALGYIDNDLVDIYKSFLSHTG